MSDSAQRDSAVFGGLEAFDDHNVDPDAVDRMLFNFSTTNDPQDWQLDALSPDFNPLAPPSYPSLSTNYIDSNPTLPTNTSTQLPSASIPSSQNRRNIQNQQQSTSIPNTTTTQQHLQNDTQNVIDSTIPNTTSDDITTNTTQKSPQTISIAMSTSLPITPPVSTTSRKRLNPSTTSPNTTRSAASSGSSARQRTSTATCNNCGKNISTNGANFRRHEQACRRQQRNGGTSSARPPSSSSLANPSSASLQHVREEPFGNPSNPTSASDILNRRDSDLLNTVRRLETSINTLDVNARLCLRDALVSLSNKAANPQIQPTPEQEAMNRAAEFLVLRMLFLSGQNVMHTPPGTASPYQDPHAASTTQQVTNTNNVTNNRGLNNSQQPDEPDDGTVAASTGVRGASVTQNSPRVPKDVSAKQEDKPTDGT